MKISIITVCFNSELTIARTLQSVKDQTYNNIEHIIVDGGSTDDTLGVIANQGDHFKIISEKDNGIYDAMNKGVRLATGEIIAFLNADDYYKDVNVLSKIASLMRIEGLDALYGDVEFFHPWQKEITVRVYDSGYFSPANLGWGWMPAHPGLFMRRILFENHGLFSIGYRITGDFEFIARVFKHRQLRYRHLSESLVRMQTGGVSTSGWMATLQLNREMMLACRDNDIPTNWIKLLSRYPLKILGFLRISF